MFQVGELTGGLGLSGVVDPVKLGHGPLEFLSEAHVFNMAAHAAVGCGSAVASGGECGPGALSGAVGSFTTPLADSAGFAGGLAITTTAGGLASVAGGGKFGNGAVTAAFGYLYNRWGELEELIEEAAYLPQDELYDPCGVRGWRQLVCGGRGGASGGARGGTIRNGHLAGKQHPDTKIPFDKNGFPDFSGVAKTSVDIKPTGSRAGDVRAANNAAGLKNTPEGYVWHHHQNGTTMQLVPGNVHSKTGHTGGFSIQRR
jgi:hypothetical protein